MTKALILSFLLHSFFVIALAYSAQFSAAVMRQKIDSLNEMGVRRAEELYRPTEVNIRFGEVRRDLPPPRIRTTTPTPPPDAPVYQPQKTPPEKTMPKPRPEKPQPSAQDLERERERQREQELKRKRDEALALIDQFRQMDGMEVKERPREDNFPTRLDGEKDSIGTGGSAELQASAAQLALQAAMRSHFELPQASLMRRQHPDAVGYLSVALIASGTNLQIRSLRTIQSSGFRSLDLSCENAVRKALREESFAPDVINELSGQETLVTCQF